MPTKKLFKVCPLTYLKIRLRNNEKTCSSSRYYFVFWRHPHSFWRYLLTTILLQKINIAQAIAPRSSISATEQSIHHRRGDVGINLSHLIRFGKDRDVPPFKTQWCLSIPHGVTHLSQSYDPEAFPPSDGSFSTSQIKKTSRLPQYNCWNRNKVGIQSLTF